MKAGFLFAIVLILIIAIPVSLTSCASTNRITPLMIASKEGNIESVREFIASGADVNAKTTDSGTSRSIAKDKKHLEIIELLKEAGAKE